MGRKTSTKVYNSQVFTGRYRNSATTSKWKAVLHIYRLRKGIRSIKTRVSNKNTRNRSQKSRNKTQRVFYQKPK